MTNRRCECGFRIGLVGAGCRYCQPQEYIDRLIEQLEELSYFVKQLEDAVPLQAGFMDK